jgi:hypothetical protein
MVMNLSGVFLKWSFEFFRAGFRAMLPMWALIVKLVKQFSCVAKPCILFVPMVSTPCRFLGYEFRNGMANTVILSPRKEP